MKEYPMRLPISFSYKRNKFEEKLIEFSNKIFQKKIQGISFALLHNGYYIYMCYNKRPFTYMFIFSYFLILVFHIIILQLVRTK
jgi:hypothetical protein